MVKNLFFKFRIHRINTKSALYDLTNTMKLLSCSTTLWTILCLSFKYQTVRALYPSELEWSTNQCTTGYDKCGILEFCSSGQNSYGYRIPGASGCSYPGPLIRLEAGKKYEFTLRNNQDNSVDTNIHTHGLHVVGAGDGDDITRSVSPGNCLKYTWDIASDHPSGTYWYHSHKHESTADQVSGGAFGALIVSDKGSEFGNNQVPAWAYNEHLLMISKLGNTVEANGQSEETFSISANVWNRLRVAVVDPKGAGGDVKFVFSNSCEVRKVANDGVWASTAGAAGISGTVYPLTGSSRADFAIRCPNTSDSIEIQLGQKSVATITTMASSETSELLSYTIVRPTSLQELDGTISETKSIGMSGSQIDGNTWDENNSVGTIEWNAVHEWTLSGTGAHPFHLHLYHMQIVGDCGNYDNGEFYDTISTSGSCTVRFKSADFGQRMVLHCHVLSHEDNGAMVWYDVQGSGMPVNNEDGSAFVCSAGAPPATNPPSVAPPPPPPATDPPSVAPPTPPLTCAERNDFCNAQDCCEGLVCKSSGKCGNGPSDTAAPPTVAPSSTPSSTPSLVPSSAPSAAPSPTPCAARNDPCSNTLFCCDGFVCRDRDSKCGQGRYMRH